MPLPSDLAVEITLETPSRIDVALLRHLKLKWPALSRTRLKEWFDEKRILIDGRPLDRAEKLEPGRYAITVQGFDQRQAEPSRATPSPRGCFLEVLYEDADLLALNKTSGIPSVPHSSDETDTAVGAALARDARLMTIGRGGLEPSILHRLDTGTSGVILFARTQDEFARLRAGWNTGLIRKVYRALTRSGNGAGAEFTFSFPLEISTPLAHDPKSSKRMVACEGPYNRLTEIFPARTRLLAARKIRSGFYDLTIEIESGVMHQIRCHLHHLGWPILGDSVYRGVPSTRLWLHAWRLEIVRPDGSLLKIEAPMPAAWPV